LLHCYERLRHGINDLYIGFRDQEKPGFHLNKARGAQYAETRSCASQLFILEGRKMTTEMVQSEIRRFISLKNPEVLCIRGKWGVGKTYAWKRYLQEEREALSSDRYAYVSLFGISTLDEFKYAIFENTIKKNRIGCEATPETLAEAWAGRDVLARKLSGILRYLNMGKDFYGIATQAFFFSIRNQTICIDDYERKGDNLKGKDVLGLISYLKEQRGCKVVLLLNDNALPDSEKLDFNKLFEKVVDVSVHFSPTPMEACEIALSPEMKCKIGDNLRQLGVSNIRIIKKIEALIERVIPLLDGYHEQILAQAMHSLVLLGWSIYAPESAPTEKFLGDWGRWAFDVPKEKALSSEEARWKDLLNAYQFSGIDAFDRVLLDGVHNGYFVAKDIRAEASKLDIAARAGFSRSLLQKSWNLVWDSFDGDQQEIVDELWQVVTTNIKYVRLGDLNDLVGFLRFLGENEKVTTLIQLYMDKLEPPDDKVTLIPAESGIKDLEIIKAFEARAKLLERPVIPGELLMELGSEGSWGAAELEQAANLSVEEYLHVFKQLRGSELSSVLAFCFRFSRDPSPPWVKIFTKAKEALQMIGVESQLNAFRVKRFGVTESPE